MHCKPEIVFHRNPGKPRVSVILTDWGVRESFHSLYYLNRQTADRKDYELIWVEFYDRKPEELQRLAAGRPAPVLDKWYVLGYPDDCVFHRHRLYNAGLLAAAGEVCVICHSDAIFRPTFIENVLRAFEETPSAVIHIDEVRNEDWRFYPFNYPSLEDVLGLGCVNWKGVTTRGLSGGKVKLHEVDYGACLVARRRDLLAIGGADEHPDYLGYSSGPYEMTFRLVNYHGRPERWLHNEYLYHVRHPNPPDLRTAYQGPHDGRSLSLRALDARASYRVSPYRRNPLLRHSWAGEYPGIERFLEFLKTREEPRWKCGAQPPGSRDEVYRVARNYQGFNLFAHAGRWYALNERVQAFNPGKARRGGYRSLLQADTLEALEAEIEARAVVGEGLPEPTGVWDRLRCKLFAQPLSYLPLRAWRKTRRFLASLRPAEPSPRPCSLGG
jgi:hypothetical protein